MPFFALREYAYLVVPFPQCRCLMIVFAAARRLPTTLGTVQRGGADFVGVIANARETIDAAL